MSQKYFDEGLFRKDAYFIDAAGFRYDLKEVKKVRNSRNPLHWFRPSPAIVVDVELKSPTSIELNATKELLISLVVMHGWHSQGDQSAPKFKKMIDAAHSFHELINLISFYGEWQG